MTSFTDSLKDVVSTIQLPLQIPSILVRGAQGAASKVTGLPPVSVPQTAINAVTGQTAAPEDVQTAINAIPLPSIDLPDFSLSNVLGNAESKIGTYALIGGLGLVALLALAKPGRR